VSFDALSWAAKCNPGSPAKKLVLLALAECAQRENNTAFPSIAAIAEFSSLNRKTIILALDQLEADGFIVDTGEKVGRTKQIKVYHLSVNSYAAVRRAECHYVYRLTHRETGEFYVGVRSFLGDPEQDSYRGSGRWPTGAAYRGEVLDRIIIAAFDSRTEAEQAEAAMIEQSMKDPRCRNIAKEFHKRDTIPKTGQLNSSTFSRKESQKRDTEPVREPVKHTTRAHVIPDHWKPEPFGSKSKCAPITASWTPDELETQLEHFTAHHRGKGNRFVDWQDAWKTWVLNSRTWAPRTTGPPGQQSEPSSFLDHLVRKQAATTGHSR
jgi:hypothetical protein